MSKVVLVIDMPKYCIDCPCHFAGMSTVVCGVTKKKLITDDIKTYKPEWCPLRELPNKKDSMNLNFIMEKCKDMDSIMDSVLKQFIVDGYNACIDELLKR